MAHKQTVFRLTLHSNPKQIRRVETFLHKINRVAHLDEIELHKLMVSLTEAVNNAIVHGNKLNETKKVVVRCELLPDWLVVSVTDEGRGFTLDKVRNPLRKKNLLRDSGRGIFLMRTLMNKVEYEIGTSGVEVRLWLDLRK
ncbi:MAG: putative anti-sigma regulatory factor, serine/threonine protein kinase [Bacteroidetes bacterium]|nr:putative anti-sigma regulatory factor, serine/threonine protein kinase [Bacteroidota bacterium]